jgi:hypothetical protein
MVWVALPPAATDAHVIEVLLMVQALSEYNPTFGAAAGVGVGVGVDVGVGVGVGVVIVPEESTVWLTTIAPKVEVVSTNAAIVKAITNIFEALVVAIYVPTFTSTDVLRLNKHYFVMIREVYLFIINTKQIAKKLFKETKKTVKAPSLYNKTTTTLYTKSTKLQKTIPKY